MKVYHIAPALSKTGGGISETLINLCKVQLKAGLSVSAFGGDLSYPDEILGIEYKKWNFSTLLNLFFQLKCSRNNKVIIHVHGAWTLSFVYVAILMLFSNKKIKFIYQAHGLLASNLVHGKSFYKKLIAWNLYQRFILRNSDFIISTSQREINDFKWCNPDLNKVFEIPLGISEVFFVPIDNDNIRSTSLLFMSQIIPVKGLEILLESFYRLKNESKTMIFLDV